MRLDVASFAVPGATTCIRADCGNILVYLARAESILNVMSTFCISCCDDVYPGQSPDMPGLTVYLFHTKS